MLAFENGPNRIKRLRKVLIQRFLEIFVEKTLHLNIYSIHNNIKSKIQT